jgi:hypothetical protein
VEPVGRVLLTVVPEEVVVCGGILGPVGAVELHTIGKVAAHAMDAEVPVSARQWAQHTQQVGEHHVPAGWDDNGMS